MKLLSYLPAALLITIALPAAAATYAVKQDGSGDYTTIQACADAAQAGDTCIVSAGTYDAQVQAPRSGTAGSPITFVAAPGAKPKVTGGFDVTSRSYITIDGFKVNATIQCNPNHGSACQGIKILNNAIDGASIGIQMRASDVLVSDNTFNNMSNDMIRQFGDRWTIRNNRVIGEVEPSKVHMDFFQSFCGGGLVSSYTLLENNEYIDITGGNTHFSLVNSTNSCNDPVVNSIYRYNKIRNIGSLAIYIDNDNQAPGCKDNSIYNNTFVDLVAGSPAGWQDYACQLDASTSSSGLNNIFYNALDSSGATGFSFASGGYQAHNLYYDPDANMTFGGAAQSELNAVKNEDPRLGDPANNDFSLQLGSPAIDKGGALTQVAAGDSGSGTMLVVDAAEFFQPGWGGADPDTIAVGSASNTVQISAIDYPSNTIMLEASVSRSSGDPVYLFKDSDGTPVLLGAAPDIGAVEYGTAGAGGTAGSGGSAGAGGSAGGGGGAGAGASGGTGQGSGGTAAGSGGAAGPGGTTSAGAESSEDSGACGCRTAGSRRGHSLLTVFALLGAALASRRRRSKAIG